MEARDDESDMDDLPTVKGKSVDSKVLDDWNRANSNSKDKDSKGSQKGPVKVSLASKDSSKTGKPPVVSVAAGKESSTSGYEVATASAKELQENDSVEVTDLPEKIIVDVYTNFSSNCS